MASVIYCKRGDNLFLFNGELADDTLEMIKLVREKFLPNAVVLLISGIGRSIQAAWPVVRLVIIRCYKLGWSDILPFWLVFVKEKLMMTDYYIGGSLLHFAVRRLG